MFSVITRESVEPVRSIHDRMPLMLKQEDVTGNGDGVTNLDALMIQRYEAGLVTKLPVN